MESVFQFSNPMLLKLDFALNDEFVGDGRTEIKVKLGIETRISREEDNSAVVVLCVTVGGKSQEDPFSIYAEEGARFGWKEGAYEDEALDRLLKQNAPALLLSYLRPMIANVTASSHYSAYDIPFMNFKEEK